MASRRPTHANHTPRSTASARRAYRSAQADGRPDAARPAASSARSSAHGTPDSAARTRSAAHRRTGRTVTRRGQQHAAPQPEVRIPRPGGGDIVLTRRQLLLGAAGIAGAAAVVGGAAYAQVQKSKDAASSLDVLSVPTSAVRTLDDLNQVEDYNTRMRQLGSYELPLGTLVWANDDNVAACLIPTESAKPLTQVGLLSLKDGACPRVLTGAVGLSEGFEIYDARATQSGLVWTEADILDGVWRVYTARLSNGTLGAPTLAEEGNTADWDTPTIALAGDNAFWQVIPNAAGPHATDKSRVRRTRVGSDDAQTVLEARGRMACAPYAGDDYVVVAARVDSATVHYQLTRIDASSGSVTDTLALPSAMKPVQVGFGTSGFSFSFDAIYNYGDGIANLGTYTPAERTSSGNYHNRTWFRFGRVPTAAPAWCGDYFIVKSTTAVCGIDLDSNEYFALNVESGTDTYGEYLASSGVRSTVVTYANINHIPVSGTAVSCCRVRVWQPGDATKDEKKNA